MVLYSSAVDPLLIIDMLPNIALLWTAEASLAFAGSVLLLGPLSVEPVGLPLLVVEGGLVKQVLEGGKRVVGTEDENGEDNQVQSQLAQEAVLLVVQACTGPAVHKVCQEVAHHCCAPIGLLSLHSIEHMSQ